MKKTFAVFFGLSGVAGLLSGCSPTVEVKVPDKPIVINMNMKIEHTVRLAVKKDLEKAEKENPALFE